MYPGVQTDVVQTFFNGTLDDVDIYIQPPARYACPENQVLKLCKAIYGLHQAPVKFKQEVVVWFRETGYRPANDSETVWVKRVPEKKNKAGSVFSGGLIVHASRLCTPMIFSTFLIILSCIRLLERNLGSDLTSRLDQC